jgi:type VI protein secretion system component VasK
MNSIPRWALIGGVTIGFLAVGAIGTWAGTSLQAAIDTNYRQDSEIRVLQNEVAHLKGMDGKLDRILERLP